MDKKIIAFIGLGAMGSNSARLLVQAGFQVRGFDLSAPALQALSEAGGEACQSAAEAMRGADCAGRCEIVLPAS